MCYLLPLRSRRIFYIAEAELTFHRHRPKIMRTGSWIAVRITLLALGPSGNRLYHALTAAGLRRAPLCLG